MMKFNFTLVALILCGIVLGFNSFLFNNVTLSEQRIDSLYAEIVDLDAKVFGKGFNQCDLQALRESTAEDFEFYHDQAGTNGSRESFVQSIAKYVCAHDYQAFRRLVPTTMKVFPLYRNNELYGAIQTAEHEFYALYPDKKRQLTDTAKLFTLWIKKKDSWQMRRSFSYDRVSYEM